MVLDGQKGLYGAMNKMLSFFLMLIMIEFINGLKMRALKFLLRDQEALCKMDTIPKTMSKEANHEATVLQFVKVTFTYASTSLVE